MQLWFPPPYDTSPRYLADCNDVSRNGEGDGNEGTAEAPRWPTSSANERERVPDIMRVHFGVFGIHGSNGSSKLPRGPVLSLLWYRRRRHCGGRSLPSFLPVLEKVYMTFSPASCHFSFSLAGIPTAFGGFGPIWISCSTYSTYQRFGPCH